MQPHEKNKIKIPVLVFPIAAVRAYLQPNCFLSSLERKVCNIAFLHCHRSEIEDFVETHLCKLRGILRWRVLRVSYDLMTGAYIRIMY